MAMDLRSSVPRRGGRLLKAIRRSEFALGQMPVSSTPEAAPAAIGAGLQSPLETPKPDSLEPPTRRDVEPASPAALADLYVSESPASQAPPRCEADVNCEMLVEESRPRTAAPPTKLHVPRWPEIDELALSILGDFPELVSAVIACASIDRSSASSLVAGPLARAIAARPGDQILLVEADLYAGLRAPATLHQPKAGLAEVFAGKVAWSEAVLPTAVERLSYLPAGLAGDAFPVDGLAAEQLWAELKGRYKYIVIDAGPAGEGLAAGWLAYCDEIYLVVELGRTDPRRARKLARRIAAAGGKVRGAVVLDVGD